MVDEDDVDGRADELMARMAALRQRRSAGASDPAVGDPAEPNALVPPAPGPATGVPRPSAAEPWPSGPREPEASADPPTAPQPVLAPPIEPSRRSAGPPPVGHAARPVALPPWQVPPSPLADDDVPAQETGSMHDRIDPPFAAVGDVPPAPPVPPAWPVPPAGWIPGPPPPPPGWPGPPPPWRPPAESSKARPPGDEGGATAGSPNGERPAADGHAAGMGPKVAQPLAEADVLGPARLAPRSGWRRMTYRFSGGRIDPGISRRERERLELLALIRRPVAGDFRIAVLSLKGGVGKTATTLGLGSALATVRTDRVIAVDANPDRGTLAERVPDASTASTVRDLLRDRHIKRYADVRSHTRMTASRLEVLASEQDPAVAEVFGESDYRRTMDVLRQYYNVILTDCGTGIMHSAMAGVLDLAQTIVLVSSPAIDAARSAAATLDWLVQHGYGALVRDAHVVFSASRPGAQALKLDKVSEHFSARCGSLHVIPFDPHLAEGAEFDFGLLKPATAEAYLELAGAVSEDFSRRQSVETG